MEAGGPFPTVPHFFEQVVVLVNLEPETLSDVCAFHRGCHRQGQGWIRLGFAEQLLRPAWTARHPDDPLSPSGERQCKQHGAQEVGMGRREAHVRSYAKVVG